MTNILGETSEGKKDDPSFAQSAARRRDVRRGSQRSLYLLAWDQQDECHCSCGGGSLAEDNNPIVSLLALEAVRSLVEGLPAF